MFIFALRFTSTGSSGNLALTFGWFDDLRGATCTDPIGFLVSNQPYNYVSFMQPNEDLWLLYTLNYTPAGSQLAFSTCGSSQSITDTDLVKFDDSSCASSITTTTDGCSSSALAVLNTADNVIATSALFQVSNKSPASGLVSFSYDGCFAGWVIVEESKRGFIPLSELNLGDWVRSSDGSWVQMLAWMHLEPNTTVEFIEIFYSGKKLALTAEHFIHKLIDGEIHIVPARDVNVGDYLIGDTGNPVLVESLSTEFYQGMYAPLTSSGELLVEGVLASCFVEVPLPAPFYKNSHSFGLIGTLPLRYLPVWVSSTIWSSTTNSTQFHQACALALQLSSVIEYIWKTVF
jgi:hypothetical protein